jgi:LPXTG-site transpeptidase (sortase) family protein
MNTKKMMLWLITAVFLTLVFAGAATMQVSAVATFTLTNDYCKDVKNEGIEFRTPVSITDPTTEKFRSNIEVEITDPNGIVSNTGVYEPGTDVVKEVALYAASDSTEYQCQQLTTTADPNDFSCNSFPVGGTISAVHVTFIPNITGTAPNEVVVHGEYTIKIIESDTTPANVLLTGTAKIDAASTACAQNQGTGTFTPNDANAFEDAFIYSTETCTTPLPDPQISFNENSTNPFRIVSFPLGETINSARIKLLVTPETNAFDYTVVLNFKDSATPTPITHTITYDYTKGTTIEDAVVTLSANWSTAVLPITLIGGTLDIDDTSIVPGYYPTDQMNFKMTFYYENIDPTLGYENSMFHFERDMSVQFADRCPDEDEYAVSPTAYDSCKAKRQSFSFSFVDPATGDGLDVSSSEAGAWIVDNPADRETTKHNVYFMIRRCLDAACTTNISNDGAYVSSVTVSDGWETDKTYGVSATGGNMWSKTTMYTFENTTSTPSHPFRLRRITVVAEKPGTYIINAFKTGENSDMTESKYLYVTVPQLDSDLSCYTPGNDGRFEAAWDGCNEDWDSEQVEFKAVNESYSFISNYSNQKMTFTLSPSESFMPTALEMNELYCEWQVLAEGYSADGGSCGAQSITLPPYTRAIVTGGKFTMNGKPSILDDKPYLISYYREETGNDMTLIMQMSIKECKQEKIPDTGYSLRSPQPLAGASKSDIIFTGNSLQIPAIGLGMETPIPIVHVSYIGGSFDNGWDLTMVGGYIGELEGGAYIPYAGNSVLTGHYYSQGVFVNLTGLHLEDEIYVFATDGMKYVYKVNNSFYTKPNDVYQLFQPNGEKSLTLVTCDSYNLITDEYDNRYVVMATLDHSEPYQMP